MSKEESLKWFYDALQRLVETLKLETSAGKSTVAIDRLGGALKLKTGRVVRDDIQIDNLGKPSLGKRYMFFARGVNGGSDISLIKSYELADGKVFTNDSRPSRLISTVPGVPKTWAAEPAFVEAVRKEVRSEVGRLK